MKYSIHLIGIISLVIVSCKKDEVPEKNVCGTPHTSYITSTDLVNCKYKPGTYWVYIDSVTLFTDSIRVIDFNQDPLQDMCGNTYQNHTFNTLTYPSKLTRYVVVAGGLFKNFEGSVNSGMLIYDDYNSALMSNEIRHDSLFVYDQFYYNVLQVEIMNDVTEGNKRSIYYINSDFGFLKHEIYDNTALISEKILKNKNIVR